MMTRLTTLWLMLYILPGSTFLAYAQPTPAVITNQTTTPISGSPSPGDKPAGSATSERSTRLREGFKTVAEGSRGLTGWCLAIIGASVAMIISTSYFRPSRLLVRTAYLLFIPTWILLAASIYYGNLVTESCISVALGNEKVLDEVGITISPLYENQRYFLQAGLLFFSIWLVLFLLWWVFGKDSAFTANANKEAK